MLRRGLRMKRRKLVARASKAMIQPLQHEMDPLAPRLQKRHLQARETIEDAGVDDGLSVERHLDAEAQVAAQQVVLNERLDHLRRGLARMYVDRRIDGLRVQPRSASGTNGRSSGPT